MKPWYASKIIWLNVVLVVAGALSVGHTGLPPEVIKWIALVGGIANVLLRTVTGQPIGK